jgi:surfactin synthase thioesterase subunit
MPQKTGSVTSWLRCTQPEPGARTRVVCVPFAGGGASAFGGWPELFGASVEVWAACLPGREQRFGEPVATDMAELAGPLAAAVPALVQPPYVVFGHSMGGLIAFETARRIVASGGPAPEHLVVSAANAPHVALPGEPHRLDRAGVVDWLVRLGGAPDELLRDPEVLDLYLPTLLADLALCAGYAGSGRPAPLAVPMTALAGDADELAPVEAVAGWQHYATAGFELVVLPGGHFFLQDHPAEVAAVLRRGPRH